MAFLGQFATNEINLLLPNVLPVDHLISFFYDATGGRSGFGPIDETGGKVLVSKVADCRPQSALEKAGTFEELFVDFRSEWTLPSSESALVEELLVNEPIRDAYHKAMRTQVDRLRSANGGRLHQLFGCQLVGEVDSPLVAACSYHQWDWGEAVSETRLRQSIDEAKNWDILARFDSMTYARCPWDGDGSTQGWDDGGFLFFCVRPEGRSLVDSLHHAWSGTLR